MAAKTGVLNKAESSMGSTGAAKIKSAFTNWSNVPQMVIHQGACWACVLWMGWTGPVLMLGFIALHFALTRDERRSDLNLVVAATIIGLLLDNALAWGGFVTYVGGPLLGYCPLWLVAIWAGFGATLRHSQQVLVRNLSVALATGFIGGPLAYLGGVKLERLTVHGAGGWLAVSVLWGDCLFLLYRLVSRVSHPVHT